MGDVTLDNKSYKFNELEKKYYNFRAPAFEINIDGKNLVREGVGVKSIVVDTSTEKADSFFFVISNAFDITKRDFKWLDKFLAIGKYVEIKLGYVDKLETVFYGLITSLNFDFSPEESPKVVVSGMDKTFLMMKGVKSRSWIKKKHSDVAKVVASKYISGSVLDNTGVVHEIVEQSRVTDYQFLSWLAKENNYEFFIVGKTMYFRKPHKKKTPVITLEYGKNLRSFSAEVDIADQISEVVVRAWDETKKKEIEAKAKKINKMGSSKSGAEIIRKVCGSDSKDYIYANVSSQKEAEEKAEALLNEHAMKLVSGYGESMGIPEIRAGKYIKMDHIGKQLSQLYYITSATHTMDASGYITAFTIGGNVI